MLKAATSPTLPSSIKAIAAANVDAADFAARYGGLSDGCRACPHFGAQWSCPPFHNGSNPYEDTLADMPGARLHLMAFETTEADTDSARQTIDKAVLAMETPGGCAFTSGPCALCHPAECARSQGKACRHKADMRTSLQACGFNLVRAASDILGINLNWQPGSKTIFIAALLIPPKKKS